MPTIARRTVLGLALLPAGFPAFGQASPFPHGPVTVVVPLAPGDAADVSGRVLAE